MVILIYYRYLKTKYWKLWKPFSVSLEIVQTIGCLRRAPQTDYRPAELYGDSRLSGRFRDYQYLGARILKGIYKSERKSLQLRNLLPKRQY